MTTIDSLALNASQRCGIGSAHILVLKIDTEGYDANVLAGARGVLESGRVSFIMFEYINPRYRPRDASQKRLDELTAFLWEFKLGCFLVMDHFLVPVTGQWWQELYNDAEIVDVLCSRPTSALRAVADTFVTNRFAPRARGIAALAIDGWAENASALPTGDPPSSTIRR